MTSSFSDCWDTTTIDFDGQLSHPNLVDPVILNCLNRNYLMHSYNSTFHLNFLDLNKLNGFAVLAVYCSRTVNPATVWVFCLYFGCSSSAISKVATCWEARSITWAFVAVPLLGLLFHYHFFSILVGPRYCQCLLSYNFCSYSDTRLGPML